MILLVLPSSGVRSSMPVVAGAVVAVLAGVLVVRGLSRRGASAPARTAHALVGDVQDDLVARRVWPGVVLSSTVAGHGATFLIAARGAPATASTVRIPLLVLLILLVTVLVATLPGAPVMVAARRSLHPHPGLPAPATAAQERVARA